MIALEWDAEPFSHLFVYLCIQRELARQIHDIATELAKALYEDSFPMLRVMLCIGGMSMSDQMTTLLDKYVVFSNENEEETNV